MPETGLTTGDTTFPDVIQYRDETETVRHPRIRRNDRRGTGTLHGVTHDFPGTLTRPVRDVHHTRAPVRVPCHYLPSRTSVGLSPTPEVLWSGKTESGPPPVPVPDSLLSSDLTPVPHPVPSSLTVVSTSPSPPVPSVGETRIHQTYLKSTLLHQSE